MVVDIWIRQIFISLNSNNTVKVTTKFLYIKKWSNELSICDFCYFSKGTNRCWISLFNKITFHRGFDNYFNYIIENNTLGMCFDWSWNMCKISFPAPLSCMLLPSGTNIIPLSGIWPFALVGWTTKSHY